MDTPVEEQLGREVKMVIASDFRGPKRERRKAVTQRGILVRNIMKEFNRLLVMRPALIRGRGATNDIPDELKAKINLFTDKSRTYHHRVAAGHSRVMYRLFSRRQRQRMISGSIYRHRVKMEVYKLRAQALHKQRG